MALPLPASAGPLAVRRYGVADGLPQTYVRTMYRDSRGYLWIGTLDGLSRFDGDRFTNYAKRDGLPFTAIIWITEDPQGRLWVTTQGAGVARLIDEAPTGEVRGLGGRQRLRFAPVALQGVEAQDVHVMLFDPAGTPWCLTQSGLHRGRLIAEGALHLELVVPGGYISQKWLRAGLRETNGRLWFGVGDRLVRIEAGRIDIHPAAPGHEGDQLMGIIELEPGRLLVADTKTLLRFTTDASPASAEWEALPLAREDRIHLGALARDGRGAIFAGTDRGLVERLGVKTSVFGSGHGLPSEVVVSLHADTAGSLWVGTGEGLVRLGRGIENVATANGLPVPRVLRMVESRDGSIYGTTTSGIIDLTEAPARLVPGSESPPFTRVNRRLFQDRAARWWVGTERGLFRFPGPRLGLRGGRFWAAPDGLPDDAVRGDVAQGIFEDEEGRVWLGSFEGLVYRFDPRASSASWEAERLPVAEKGRVGALATDATGAVWAMVQPGVLYRRVAGRWNKVDVPWSANATAGAILQGRNGQLWIGSDDGLFVTDPRESPLRFRQFAAEHGLQSGDVWCVTEDARGRLYVGGTSGLDRLDPATGHVRHFTTADGLSADNVVHCLSDRRGFIWVSTRQGVSRLDPRVQPTDEPPPSVVLSRVRAAGEEISLPDRGASSLPLLVLPADRNDLQVEFAAPSLESAGSMRYQYRLEGTNQDWGPPTRERSVSYPRLAPGGYRFLVRGINADGVVGGEPAVVPFRVLAPIWQRWWFQALALAAAFGLAFAIQRLHLERMRAVERVRRQIAADLHDELGSGLGSIGILAGLAAGDAVSEKERRDLAERAASTAGELGTALSDIVWFLRPESATLSSLAAHIAERAGRLFPGDDPELEVRFPSPGEPIRMSLGVSRSVYLIALEALHNAARHARAHRVVLELMRDGRRWRLTVSDDGKGLPAEVADGPDDAYTGLGLTSMRQRARAIGAEVSLTRPPSGTGTVVTLWFDALPRRGPLTGSHGNASDLR